MNWKRPPYQNTGSWSESPSRNSMRFAAALPAGDSALCSRGGGLTRRQVSPSTNSMNLPSSTIAFVVSGGVFNWVPQAENAMASAAMSKDER